MYFDIAFPQRIMMSTDDMSKYYNFLNRYNGKRHLYKSVYRFNEKNDKRVEPKSAVIDKIYFDFDGPEAYDATIKFHNWLVERDLYHCIFFSGNKGFNVYVYVESFTPNMYNLGTLQKAIEKKAGIKSDQQTVGDINRVSRIPNTIHIRSKLYCIGLSVEELYKGEVFIRQRAAKTPSKTTLLGNLKLDTTKFFEDLPSNFESEWLIEINNTIKESSINTDRLIKIGKSIMSLPACIKSMLSNKNLRWRQRFFLILYLKEKGYTESEMVKILEESLSEKKFKHCVYREKQVNHVFSNHHFIFPTCDKMLLEGLCVEENCEQKDSLYR